jgi:hypothetical protein
MKHRKSPSRKKTTSAWGRHAHAGAGTSARAAPVAWPLRTGGKAHRTTKRAGIAAGNKPRFRADKPRRGPGGSIPPESAAPEMLSSSPAPAASKGDTLKGLRDVAWGDLHATAAVAAGLAAALTPGILKSIPGAAAVRSVAEDAQKAAEYWNTPEAQKVQPLLYPDGASFPP